MSSQRKKTALRHELIGLGAEVIGSANRCEVGIKGKIIDETKSTIVIKDKDRKKRLLKKNITLQLQVGGKEIIICCKSLQKRPEERLKLK